MGDTVSARDGLGLIPFADYADNDPNRLPLDGDPACETCDGAGTCNLTGTCPTCLGTGEPNPVARPCEACNAEPGELCRPWCLAVPL